MLNILLSFLLLTSRPDTLAPVPLTNLSSGDKESKIVYIGIANQFKIEDSLVKEVVYGDHYRLSGDTLTIKPTYTGTVTVTFLRGEERISMDFPSRVLGLVSITPSAAQNDTLPLDQMAKDPSFIIHSPDKDDFYKGYSLSSFVANVNNRNFNCGDSFSQELIDACKASKEGDVLRITDYSVTNPVTGRSARVKCNKTYFLKQPRQDNMVAVQ